MKYFELQLIDSCNRPLFVHKFKHFINFFYYKLCAYSVSSFNNLMYVPIIVLILNSRV